MRPLLLRTLGAALVLSAAACSDTPTAPAAPGLVGALQADADYSTFVELATATGVLPTLETGGPYTVLAPTNIAFVYLGTDAGPVLTAPEQRPTLERVLRHHVVSGVLQPEDFVDGAVLTSLEGSALTVRRIGDVVLVDGATIDLGERVETDDGVLYPASNVIRTNLTARERVELAPSLSAFSLFSARVGLFSGQGEVTLLVPTNDAFQAIDGTRELLDQSNNTDVLRRVLTTHVLPGRVNLESLEDGAEVATTVGTTLRVSKDGGVLRIGDVRVVGSPVETADGRIYLLQDVLFVGLSLADRIRIQPRVTLFPNQIRQEADVWARLNDPDEALTVFAPNDGVYTRLSGDVSTALGLPENEALRKRTRRVLVVEGKYEPEDLVDGLVLQALDGTELLVRRGSGRIFVGGIQVTPTGAATSNGSFYTVDAFLPPFVDAFDSAILQGFTTFAFAARQAGLESLFRTEELTLFPPTNAAFSRASGFLLLPRGTIVRTLEYHASRDLLTTTPTRTTVTTLNGVRRELSIQVIDRVSVQFLDATIRVVSVQEANNGRGILYGLEALTFPP